MHTYQIVYMYAQDTGSLLIRVIHQFTMALGYRRRIRVFPIYRLIVCLYTIGGYVGSQRFRCIWLELKVQLDFVSYFDLVFVLVFRSSRWMWSAHQLNWLNHREASTIMALMNSTSCNEGGMWMNRTEPNKMKRRPMKYFTWTHTHHTHSQWTQRTLNSASNVNIPCNRCKPLSNI